MTTESIRRDESAGRRVAGHPRHTVLSDFVDGVVLSHGISCRDAFARTNVSGGRGWVDSVELTAMGIPALPWIWFPVAALAVSMGLGYLLNKLTGGPIRLLFVTLGFLTATFLVAALLYARVPGRYAAAAVVALGAVGLLWAVLDWRDGKTSPPIGLVPGVCAAVAAFVVGLLPILVEGHVAIMGYRIFDDAALHAGMADYLFQYSVGHQVEPGRFAETAYVGYINQGYPLGAYSWPLIGKLVTGAIGFEVYSVVGGMAMAFLALLGTAILLDLGVRRGWAAVGGFAVATCYMAYSFVAQGGWRDVVFATSVYALFWSLTCFSTKSPLRTAIPAVVMAGAAFTLTGLLIAGWILPGVVTLAIVLAVRFARQGFPSVKLDRKQVLVGGGVAALLVAGAIPALLKAGTYAQGFATSRKEPGNIPIPLQVSELSGIGFLHDFRFAQEGFPLLMAIVACVVALFFAYGVYKLVVRRSWLLLAAVAYGAVVTTAISITSTPYWEAKVFVALAPGLALVTVFGIWSLTKDRDLRRRVGQAAAVAGSIGVVVSIYFVYSGAILTPAERFGELRKIDEKFAGNPRTLFTEREGYGMYFLPRLNPFTSYLVKENIPGRLLLDAPVVTDLSQWAPGLLDGFSAIVERAGPLKSTPPQGWESGYGGKYYQVWRHVGPTNADTVNQGNYERGILPLDCKNKAVKQAFRSAEKNGRDMTIRLASGEDVWLRSEPGVFDPHPGWKMTTVRGMPSLQNRSGTGAAVASFKTKGGRFKIWLRGYTVTGLDVAVDGKYVGRVTEGETFAHDQFFIVGKIDLRPGKHTVSVTPAPVFRLAPGAVRYDELSAIVLEPDVALRDVTVTPTVARRYCGHPSDWIAVASAAGSKPNTPSASGS